MEISQFVKKIDRESERIEQFYEMLKTIKTKEEKRKIEMGLLAPAPIPVYNGKKAGRSRFQQCSLRLVFHNKKQIERMAQFVTINTYVENNCHDTDIFLALFNLLEEKKLKWDAKNKKLTLNKARKLKRRHTKKRRIK